MRPRSSKKRRSSRRSAPQRDVPSLKKRWGQNHLVSGHICRPLIEFLAPAGQRVLEIGPGGGVLTSELLDAGANVLACEVDLEWLFHLRQQRQRGRFGDGLTLVGLDACTLDPSQLPAPTLAAGNLPFNVATPIIEALLRGFGTIPRMAFMVQKEVADRLVARPGNRAYGSLSAIVAAQAKTQLLGRISPGSFRPPPKVEAAFVGFTLVPPPLPARQMKALIRLIRQCFAQRRKTLRNNLQAVWGKDLASAVLEQLDLDTRCRAEEFGLDLFLNLYTTHRDIVNGIP